MNDSDRKVKKFQLVLDTHSQQAYIIARPKGLVTDGYSPRYYYHPTSSTMGRMNKLGYNPKFKISTFLGTHCFTVFVGRK